MNLDIEGIERGVRGFSKHPDEDGDHIMIVEYKLNNISIDLLRKIFKVDMTAPDQAVRDVIYPLDINATQEKELQSYLVDGLIDVNQYDFELHAWQADGYDWSNGYARKINEDINER